MNATGAASRGVEWIVEAYGCEPARLADKAALEALFAACVAELALRPVQPAQWHVFPAPGGVTGLLLLAESHLTVHTFPESGFAALNLYCCRPRPPWPFAERLREHLNAARVEVRELVRG
ncbi:MAG TPA: adenosylmethionine decarboxylase [Myxococcales bacterium]|nr:adenosylmethionine decarboxylase [Myxococcales bacterium]